ncbi:DUF2993 domain-containing protein [Streptomyces sp. HNM0645]|uniref:LmeA family phospholipid-binding protein n=1 Tax=Streptomyces sp. HNM0645 TaxID=2782343 RepID=UPI0024B862DD|nr:DUF2993 domain-containing protein [Streptomyces sp. HNM0645]MDI9886234.1 DUF2993 domain-containing protein [Streptomyces sp. HNM0645]
MTRRRADGRRRLLPWTALVTAVLLVALPAADRVCATVAEKRLAERIAARQGALVGAPRVSIGGFPFLLSAARGSFPEVAVRADAVTKEGRAVRASVELREVTETGDGYTAASADARFTAPFDSLGAGLGAGATLSADGDGRLRVDREVLGLPLTVVAEPRLTGRTITVVPVAASFAGRPVDPAGPRISAAFAGRELVVPELPAGLAPTRVSVGEAGVTLHARGHDVRLT